MQVYELIMVERDTSRVLLRLPTAEQPWGTFGRGEIVRIDGDLYPVDQLMSQFAEYESVFVCTSVVILGPILPKTALAELVIPESAKRPEIVPPAPVAERRAWWRRQASRE